MCLVAADTGNDFAWHGGHPASHQLQGLAVGVKRLNGDRRIGRDSEHRRAVGFHRDSSEDSLWLPGAVGADAVIDAGDFVICEVVGEQAKLLDRSKRDTFKSAPFVNIFKKDNRIISGQVDTIDNGGRTFSFAQRNRFEQGVAFDFL